MPIHIRHAHPRVIDHVSLGQGGTVLSEATRRVTHQTFISQSKNTQIYPPKYSVVQEILLHVHV